MTVQSVTHEVGGLTIRDLAVARQISTAARVLDVPGGPSPAQDIDVTVDELVVADVLPFWRAVLGYQQAGDQDLLDPHGRLPSIWFQAPGVPRPRHAWRRRSPPAGT